MRVSKVTVCGLEFLRFGVEDSGFRVLGVRPRAQGSGFRLEGFEM